MYLYRSFFPIKIVSHKNVILKLDSLEIPKILPTAIFTMDANSIFSDPPSLAHTLSLSLWQVALFPFFPFQYKNDGVA
jgi:hypothetical protein